MTMTSVNSRLRRRRLPGISHLVSAWIAEAREQRCIRRETRALSALSDRILRDIGVEGFVATRPTYQNRQWW